MIGGKLAQDASVGNGIGRFDTKINVICTRRKPPTPLSVYRSQPCSPDASHPGIAISFPVASRASPRERGMLFAVIHMPASM
jgi:hypothetical protein